VEADGLPAVFGTATPSQARAIGRLAGIVLVTSNEQGRARNDLRTSQNDTIDFPQIDHSYNSNNDYAHSVGIGQFEALTGGGYYSTHEAFKTNYSQIHYQVTPNTCTPGDGTCDTSPWACVASATGNVCSSIHADWVASILTAYRHSSGGGFGASESSLYYANNSVVCASSGAAQAYAYFAAATSPAVTEVNESFDCESNYSQGALYDGIVQDWYARHYGMLIAKSAGNDAQNDENPNENVACAYSLNSLCVGSQNHENTMSCFSSWVNPPGTDREGCGSIAAA
jgi:hypothetical protein